MLENVKQMDICPSTSKNFKIVNEIIEESNKENSSMKRINVGEIENAETSTTIQNNFI